MAKLPKSKEDTLHKIPLRITDTTLRDSHQSLWATRMRTDDILKIADVVDNVGYYSLEVWGGATFDVCMRFLRENPWERLRQINAKTPKTPLQMLLRGQNLVGYKNYADDLVDRFVALSVENGMDIFRCFDALNDARNLESAVKAVKKYGGHAQGTLSYTISPVHTVEKFVEAARDQVALGIDSLCIKDMAGILTPISAEKLVSALIAAINIPIQLHCHASSGMATSTYVEAVRAGAGAIDCAVASMSGFSSQPPVETLVTIFKETNYSAELDMDALARVDKYMAELTPKRMRDTGHKFNIDPEILLHQIPGGMISNFRSQLAMQNALDKLPEALAEVSRVRKDLGYPPLVTPMSQIVGTQAAINVLSGERYKVVPNEVKDYLKGLYGRPPAPVDPELLKKVLGKEKPITHRPADDIPPVLPKATENVDPKLIHNEEDIVSYCILPEPATEYFKWRALPEAERPPIPADEEEKKMRHVEKPEPAAPDTVESLEAGKKPMLSDADYKGISDLLGKAASLNLHELTVQKDGFSLTLRAAADFSSITVIEGEQKVNGKQAAPAAAAPAPAAPEPAEPAKPAAPAPQPAATPAQEEKPKQEKKPVEAKPVAAPAPAAAAPAAAGKSIKAPFVGTFYSAPGAGKPRFVEPGAVVNEGTSVCVVEAMKLFNEIKAPQKCKILKVLVEDGQKVEKDQPLVAIEDA